MLSDIEIAQATKPKHINDVAKTAGIPEEYIKKIMFRNPISFS